MGRILNLNKTDYAGQILALAERVRLLEDRFAIIEPGQAGYNARLTALEAGGVIIVPPTLGIVTLSGSLQIGVTTSGTLLGTTALSTLASNIPGITFNSAARTYSGTPTGSAATIANGIVETLAGAVGSSKSSPVTVAAAGIPAFMMDFRVAANARYAGAML